MTASPCCVARWPLLPPCRADYLCKSSVQLTLSGFSTAGMSRFTTTGSWPDRTSTQDSGSRVRGVDFLMRHKWRHMDEITGPGFGHEFQIVSPAHARLAAHHVDDALDRAMMMGTGLGLCMDHHRPGPQFFGAAARMGDGGRPIHAGRLRGIGVELRRFDDADAVELPPGVDHRDLPVSGSAALRSAARLE